MSLPNLYAHINEDSRLVFATTQRDSIGGEFHIYVPESDLVIAQARIAELEEQLRYRLQSEEPAPEGIDVIKKSASGFRTEVVDPENLEPADHWLPVPSMDFFRD
jgi:hypothetical protein